MNVWCVMFCSTYRTKLEARVVITCQSMCVVSDSCYDGMLDEGVEL